jgi:hypothetical protein
MVLVDVVLFGLTSPGVETHRDRSSTTVTREWCGRATRPGHRSLACRSGSDPGHRLYERSSSCANWLRTRATRLPRPLTEEVVHVQQRQQL